MSTQCPKEDWGQTVCVRRQTSHDAIRRRASGDRAVLQATIRTGQFRVIELTPTKVKIDKDGIHSTVAVD